MNVIFTLLCKLLIEKWHINTINIYYMYYQNIFINIINSNIYY